MHFQGLNVVLVGFPATCGDKEVSDVWLWQILLVRSPLAEFLLSKVRKDRSISKF
jgi:hypothetical protein